jgi:hypothetical protein
MSATLVTLNAILREKWMSSVASNPGWNGSVLYSIVDKDPTCRGRDLHVPVCYGQVQAASSSFASAQAAAALNSSVNARFVLNTKHRYSLARVTGEAAAACQGEPLALANALKKEMDSAYKTEVRRANQHMYRDGTGSICAIPAGSVGGAVTLQLAPTFVGSGEYPDIHLIEEGMRLGATLNFGVACRVGANRIVGINQDTGIITGTGNWNALPAACADGDFLFIDGDYVNNANLCIDGLAAWCPLVPGTFGTVVTTVNPNRLAGLRYDAVTPGDTLEEGLKKAGVRMIQNGMLKSGDYIGILNPIEWAELETGMMANKTFVEEPWRGANGEVVGTLGFTGIVLLAGGKKIKFLQDVDCQYGTAWIFDRQALKLASMGTYPRVLGLDEDGSEFVRLAAADEYEVRMGGYPELICLDTGSICRVRTK